MKAKQISVIVPTLNSAETLDWTLLSLRQQRDCEVNVIVADSGSKDDTLEICRHWRVPTIYVEPGNMYRAINAGLRRCHNEWLGFLNSDDWLYPDSYLRLITQGDARGADIVYGNCDYTDVHGRFLYSFAAAKPSQLMSLFRLGKFGFTQQAAIFRQRVYLKLDGFDEGYTLSADADYYFRALLSGFHFVRLSGPSVACFRLHAKQLSLTKAAAMQSEIQSIRSKLADSSSLSDRASAALWRLGNLPHYAVRFLRLSLLSGKIRFSKSMVSPPET